MGRLLLEEAEAKQKGEGEVSKKKDRRKSKAKEAEGEEALDLRITETLEGVSLPCLSHTVLIPRCTDLLSMLLIRLHAFVKLHIDYQDSLESLLDTSRIDLPKFIKLSLPTLCTVSKRQQRRVERTILKLEDPLVRLLELD